MIEILNNGWQMETSFIHLGGLCKSHSLDGELSKEEKERLDRNTDELIEKLKNDLKKRQL